VQELHAAPWLAAFNWLEIKELGLASAVQPFTRSRPQIEVGCFAEEATDAQVCVPSSRRLRESLFV
jgi:hypothetical protein